MPRSRSLNLLSVRFVLCAFLLVFALLGTNAADTTGVIPYRTITAIYEGFAKVDPKDKLQLSVRVIPAGKIKPTSEIRLVIRRPAGSIPLKQNLAGDLLDFPLTAELQAENPGVVSNQPKGTLLLKAAIGIKYSGKLTERAAWYRDALGQANAALKAQGGRFSLSTPTLKTLGFSFDPTTQATLRIRSDGHDQTFRADAAGKLKLEVNRDLSSDAADMMFSEAPVSITPE